MDRLITESQNCGSDRLLLTIEGDVVLNEVGSRSGPIELMSATKSIVAIAIGILLKKNSLESIDAKVGEFFPEWSDGLRKDVTIRHILNHTTGIKALRTTEDIYSSGNFLQFARESTMLHPPGTNYFYNNKATQLLSGIVQEVSGLRLDLFLDLHLFRPLGIREWNWTLDKSGNPHAFAGLALRAHDLSKIGQLMLNQGRFDEHEIFDTEWASISFAQGQPYEPTCGLLWWRNSNEAAFYYDKELIQKYEHAGLSSEVCMKLAELSSKFSSIEFRAQREKMLGSEKAVQEFINFTNSNMLSSRKIEMGEAQIFSAHGYLGQYLSVVPHKSIIAVRQIDYRSVKDPASAEFENFRNLVLAIAKEA